MIAIRNLILLKTCFPQSQRLRCHKVSMPMLCRQAGSCSEIPTLLPLTICYCVRPRNATPVLYRLIFFFSKPCCTVSIFHIGASSVHILNQNYKIVELCLHEMR
ncbi:hypothetical protein T4D_11478 [Trichinella pseudospiralis]|uniref:Uncharacterized protein n=1 Tax=Trichinella pseudospiralis TaxID=6337 RepID=A0A0V1FXT7_TRIPS|nr:hypothetical protein T4D_11478 [Trichinella pseudospiralis]